jgi:hypothetical protein
MTRPTYETGASRNSEADVAKTLSLEWDCEVMKMPRYYEVDVFLNFGAEKAIAEIKCRYNSINKYPTFTISAKKVVAGVTLARELGIPYMIVVRWDEGIYYYECWSAKLPVVFQGRSDRGDWQDVEPQVEIPTSEFRPVVLST